MTSVTQMGSQGHTASQEQIITAAPQPPRLSYLLGGSYQLLGGRASGKRVQYWIVFYLAVRGRSYYWIARQLDIYNNGRLTKLYRDERRKIERPERGEFGEWWGMAEKKSGTI